MTDIEQQFNQAMIGIYRRALDEARYKASRFLQLVHDEGGVAAAKILINSKEPAEGYTELWQRKRLDLTVEALVQNTKWHSLFDTDEIERAKTRLKSYGYQVQ